MHRLPDGPTFTCLFLVVLALGIIRAYSGSFDIGFPFDDFQGIVKNPAIRSLGNVPRFFTDPYAVYPERGQPDLPPVLLASYALNYRISGLGPWRLPCPEPAPAFQRRPFWSSSSSATTSGGLPASADPRQPAACRRRPPPSSSR